MFRFINQRDNVVAIRVTQKLTDDDYAHLTPFLEHKLKRFDTLHLLVELDNYDGWGDEATVDDLCLGLDDVDHIDQLAIVGADGNWRAWYDAQTPESDWDSSVDIRYFNQYQIDEAWMWLR